MSPKGDDGNRIRRPWRRTLLLVGWLGLTAAAPGFQRCEEPDLVDLLCTAGLPAAYTHVLGTYDLNRPVYYGYLPLYVAAYLLDDSLMPALATITLSRSRLQERAGGWLKLLSGITMAVLGLLLLPRPEWLLGLG